MQYVLIAYDGTDEEAPDRRMAVREKHMDLVKQRRDNKQALYGGALLDDDGNMIGSVMVLDFDTREDLDNWLKNEEPYIKGNVWQNITVMPIKTAPHFQELLSKGFEALEIASKV